MNKISLIAIILLVSSTSHSQCKDMFIGDVYQFTDNDLFFASAIEDNNSDYYIDIFLKDEFNKNHLDLKYTYDYENTREEIKKYNATIAFNLKGLDTVYFYSKSNDLVGYGLYKKAEYYENTIESRYIAAYTPYIFNYSQKPYYASNCKVYHKNTKWIKSDNKDLENKILNTYKINKSSNIKIEHFTKSNGNTTYSMVSYDYLKVFYDTYGLNSFIVKYQNGKLTKLYETGKDYILASIFISAFTFNNEPIIFVIGRRPESDFFLNGPIFYDGEEYNFKKGDRSGTEN